MVRLQYFVLIKKEESKEMSGEAAEREVSAEFPSKSIVFRYKAFTGKTTYTELLLTKKSLLYETKNNNILAICDLSRTDLKGIFEPITLPFE